MTKLSGLFKVRQRLCVGRERPSGTGML